jgi:hypothetical protein
MTVRYALEEIKTQPGTFFPRIIPIESVRTDDVAKQIAAKSLVQPADINAVLDTLDEEIVDALVAGKNVNLDDFVGLFVTLRLKTGVTITDPDYTLDLNDVDIHVNVAVKPAIRLAVRARLLAPGSFEKTTLRLRVPQINSVFDVLSQTAGTYTSGGPIEIRGVDIDLPSDLDTDTRNGVFFQSEGNETRADIYMSEGNKKITCIVPGSVSSTADIVVRTDYGQTELREGRITGITQNV